MAIREGNQSSESQIPIRIDSENRLDEEGHSEIN